MTLPAQLPAVLEAKLNIKIKQTRSVSGGDISAAARCQLADGRDIFVKWQPAGRWSGLFMAEAHGLQLLHSTDTLRTPEVLAYAAGSADDPAFIAMEWLGQSVKTNAAAKVLGEGLALLHQSTAEQYGLDHDNFIGANPQPNNQTSNWINFFATQRFGFQMTLAEQNGHLPASRASRLERLMSRLGEWLPAQPPASLLHGDLWGGNWLITEAGSPALIDPAVYYGDREADLAFTELFGGFPSAFYDAYNHVWPLDSGYHERKELYNLYHLLNHLNLFGGGYGGSVDAVLRRFVG